MTRQPRKQRNQTERAPLHQRHQQVKATLSDDLREEYGQRSVRVNAGDTVEVMRGDFAGEEGEVLEVDMKNAVIHVEEVTLEKADGEDVPRPLDTSNVRVTDLNLEDDRREARLEGDTE
ncbi:LSU ribosomal protein L24P [Haladaptatus litoreus]|uniref:Large ribosomal subunit protein uL24 n=1 Tax=Haladaptatus litoreus TaxID=553468 RepID=A0A1N6ZNF4_9EURY|nr:50S ribosomal protein L24 [Haladaptatus litoreus]SIR28402.1 LSU ribosomal protein L24P [Haladaptatus litoreus]